jgi:transketolase C-terminal domain/subunit
MNRGRSLLLAFAVAFALPLPAVAHLADGIAAPAYAEAHDFAEHIAAFKALGATVVCVSGDDIATQAKFSTLECRVANVFAALRKLAAR